MRRSVFYPVENARQDQYRAVTTEEFRCPKKGEYYLSGAIPTAYRATNDLPTEYYIVKIVKVKVTMVERIEIEKYVTNHLDKE